MHVEHIALGANDEAVTKVPNLQYESVCGQMFVPDLRDRNESEEEVAACHACTSILMQRYAHLLMQINLTNTILQRALRLTNESLFRTAIEALAVADRKGFETYINESENTNKKISEEALASLN